MQQTVPVIIILLTYTFSSVCGDIYKICINCRGGKKKMRENYIFLDLIVGKICNFAGEEAGFEMRCKWIYILFVI